MNRKPWENLDAMKQRVPEAADLMRLLSNPTRLLLLCEIAQQESSVAELERDLGMKQPGLSQQLAELRQNGLVKTRRESRSIYYSIADARVQALLAALHGIFCSDPPELVQQHPPSMRSRLALGDVATFGKVALG